MDPLVVVFLATLVGDLSHCSVELKVSTEEEGPLEAFNVLDVPYKLDHHTKPIFQHAHGQVVHKAVGQFR